MSNPYRDMIARLAAALQQQVFCDPEIDGNDLPRQARALLDRPVAERPKPVVDYSRVPEIATEAQIRSAAQYLVLTRNCDGDLIPAIEYAIARWGCPTPQPPAAGEAAELAAELRHFVAEYQQMGRLDPENIYSIHQSDLKKEAHLRISRLTRVAELLEHPQPVAHVDVGIEWMPCVKLPITVHVRDQRPGETHSSTREGITPLRSDDLIMRGVQGEEYPIGRELFEQTYRLLPTPEAKP